MIGCLRRLGCLALGLVLLCAAAWFTRDWWLEKLGLRTSRPVAVATWEAPGNASARRAEAALNGLQSPTGPAFANLSAGELLSYLVKDFGKAMPKSVDSLQAAVIDDRVYVRASVTTADIPRDLLGPLASMLRVRERMTIGGTLRVVEPGVSELQVKDVVVGGLRVPAVAIPGLLQQVAGDRPAGIAKDGVAFATPKYIGDVRVANGKITVYKKP